MQLEHISKNEAAALIAAIDWFLVKRHEDYQWADHPEIEVSLTLLRSHPKEQQIEVLEGLRSELLRWI